MDKKMKTKDFAIKTKTRDCDKQNLKLTDAFIHDFKILFALPRACI